MKLALSKLLTVVLIYFTAIDYVFLKDITIRSCIGTDAIVSTYKLGHPPGEENQYSVLMVMYFPNNVIPAVANISIEFDSEATIELGNSQLESNHCVQLFRNVTFNVIQCSKGKNYMAFNVKGPPSGTVPYFRSLKVLDRENCEEPLVGYLEKYIIDYQTDRCGRRKVDFTELIVNGEDTKPGDWPWHAAIYELKGVSNTYICGGTLITKTIVVTAAHCVTRNKGTLVPEALSVVLGKYNFIGGDISSQEKQIFQILVHPRFGVPNRLDNDIALLKLKTEAIYNDYVQPACVWFNDATKKLPSRIIGSVVGWGFDETNSLPPQLKHASVPERSYAECVMKNPTFYGNMLANGAKFCAGWGNGTSPCNGDSGGGFMVFVPDVAGDNSSLAPGFWTVRGLVSLTVPQKNQNVCDPTYYVVFTDISKYIRWILIYTHRRSYII